MASFQKRGERWIARVNIKGYPSRNKMFDTLMEAKTWAVQIEAEMRGKCFVDNRAELALTVNDLLERYAETKLVKRTANDVRDMYRFNSIKKKLGKYSLGNINRLVISQWRDERLKEVQPATVQREMNALQAVFNRAIRDWGLTIENPLIGVYRPTFYNKRNRILSETELTLLYHELDVRRYRTRNPYLLPLTKFALETAMRRGEILGLTWDRINFEAQTLFLPITKNGQPRVVPLSKAAIEILQALPRDNKKVFPISTHVVDCSWRQAVKRAGIENFHFHDLRHIAISRIAKLVPNVIELSHISGHATLQVLHRYYHTTPEELAQKLG